MSRSFRGIVRRPLINRLLVLPPLIYGLDQLGYLMACLAVLPETWGSALLLVGMPVKWGTVVVLPLLLYRLALAVHNGGERTSLRRSILVASVWVGLGLATVVAFLSFAGEIAVASAKPSAVRVWPGTETLSDRPSLDVASDPAYNFTRIVTFELTAVVLIALVAGLCLWACRRFPEAIIFALPTSVFVSLSIYVAVAPGAWIWDYDPFIGDVVLGGVLAELVVFSGPQDPVGAVALSIAAISTWALTAAFQRCVGSQSDSSIKQHESVT